MASIRERVLDFHAKGYRPGEIYLQLRAEGVKSISKAYINQCLAFKESDSLHIRRTHLIYEMLLDMQARIQLLTEKLGRQAVQTRKDYLEGKVHPAKEIRPLPSTEPSGSGSGP